MRYTPNRKALISVLDQTKGPLTADEVYHTTEPRVPFSSVYRELRTLVDAQVLALHHTTERSSRFELAEWLSGHHHHIVCVRCMSISDISLDHESEVLLADLGERAASAVGYRLTDHTIEIEGICPKCR